MLSIEPRLTNPEIVSKIILTSHRLVNHFLFIQNNQKYLDWCDSPQSILEIIKKVLSNTETLDIQYHKGFFAPSDSKLKGKTISINRKLFTKNTKEWEYAGILCHEMSHYCGFGHNFEVDKRNHVFYLQFLVEYLEYSDFIGAQPSLNNFKAYLGEK